MTKKGAETSKIKVSKKESLFFQIYRPFLLTQFLLSIVLVAIFYFIETRQTREKIGDHAAQELTIIARDFENRYGGELRTHHENFEAYMQEYLIAPDDLQPMVARRVEHEMLRAIRNQPHYLSVTFVLPNGQQTLGIKGAKRDIERANYLQSDENSQTTSGTTKVSPIIETKREIFNALRSVPVVLHAGPLSWFIPKRDMIGRGPIQRSSGQYSVITGWPVMDLHSGALGGILLIQKDLSNLFRTLQSIKILDAQVAWIVAPDGTVLRRPPYQGIAPEDIQSLSADFEPNATVVSRGSDILIYRDFSILPDQALFRVVFGIPNHLIRQDIEGTAWMLGYTLLGSFCVIVLVAWLVSRRVSKPILHLAKLHKPLRMTN